MGDLMGKRSKKYSPQFKFKVVMETFQKDSVAEVARQYDIHPNQVTMWRKEFQENGPKIFDSSQSKREEEYRKRINQLENLMGKKSMRDKSSEGAGVIFTALPMGHSPIPPVRSGCWADRCEPQLPALRGE